MRRDIMKYMAEAAPEEGCGFILNDKTFIPVENKVSELAPEFAKNPELPQLSFAIDSATYMKYADALEVIVHSHVNPTSLNNDGPSLADQNHQRVSGVPWEVYVIARDVAVDAYRFDMAERKITPAGVYRPGIADEATTIEDFLNIQLDMRNEETVSDPQRFLTGVRDQLVLGKRFKIQSAATGQWQDNDVAFFGSTPHSGIEAVAVYYRGQYHWRDHYGGQKWEKKPPLPQLYHRLRKP